MPVASIRDPVQFRQVQFSYDLGDLGRHAEEDAGLYSRCPDCLPGQHQSGAGKGNGRASGKGIAPSGAAKLLLWKLANCRPPLHVLKLEIHKEKRSRSRAPAQFRGHLKK
jgi:hypothetical protein